jgi:cyclopropane fatty-acyl-phospholipid synthase-like methyltransferase
MNQNYDAIRDYFETATASQQRGKTSEAGLIAYASYLLDRIEPSPNARLLDVGCGDGLPMKK